MSNLKLLLMSTNFDPEKTAKILKVIASLCTYVAGLLLGLGTASAANLIF